VEGGWIVEELEEGFAAKTLRLVIERDDDGAAAAACLAKNLLSTA